MGVVVVALLAAVGAVAWDFATHRGCSGRLNATIAASPDIAPILDQLNTEWSATHPQVDGACVAVTIEAKDSALMATALSAPWDPASYGPPPDVWVPASSVWVRQASVSPVVERMIPDRQPSLARTPSVIAMPHDLAAALGWPGDVDFDWPDLAEYSRQPGFWASRGVGTNPFTFTLTDPGTSTAGLLALMAIADANNDGAVDTGEQAGVLDLRQTMHRYVEDTGDVVTALGKADAKSVASALAYTSGFPALERDVVAYNRQNPHEQLVAVYPTSGSYDADYPYLILNDPVWGTAAGPIAAAAFLGYVRGPVGRAAFLDAGYRDANRVGGPQLAPSNGVQQTVEYLPRAVLVPDSVEETKTTWTAVTRETNLLLVLDVSGSMNVKIAGTQTRLDLAKAAAIAAVKKFDAQADVGLWVFSTGLDGQKDYRVVVPLGQMSDRMPDGNSRQQEMVDQLGALRAGGNTGLYDTIAAAQLDVQGHFRANATNLVVVLTDGANDDDTGGLTLPELEQQLAKTRASGRNVPVVTVGFGADADFTTLQDISRTSGTTSVGTPSGFDINEVLLAGIFGAPAGPGE
ncbi:MAG TPA: substrate-binding and VWA domain-containing protein [Micromonosporaceae bacterium]|nr:substrate-binding and VWA domain-containing protein [Micromonosporaceae bacterium]